MKLGDDSTLEDFLSEAITICSDIGELRTHAESIRRIRATIDEPFTVAVVGRMKAGKSTLINSLLGRPLAVSDVEEATATINVIQYGNEAQTEQAIVHWRDGRDEVIPLARIREWSGKSPAVIELARQTGWIKFFADLPKLRKFRIVDTPGTGSAVGDHEDIVRQFLNPQAIDDSVAEGNKADAIIYVTPPVGRDSDAATLQDFAQGRLSGTGPYNSVCVLHKWDGLDAADPSSSAAEMAKRLKCQLRDTVAEVIPVSGTLGLASRNAPNEFFVGLTTLLRNMPAETREHALKISDRWDSDPERRRIRMLYAQLPWVSFSLIARMVAELPGDDPAVLRAKLLAKSHVEDLETFLEERFFSRASIIKRNQALRKVQVEIDSCILMLRALRSTHQTMVRMAAEVLSQYTDATPDQTRWLKSLAARSTDEARKTDACLCRLSKQWESQKGELTALNQDLRVCDFVQQNSDTFPTSDRTMLLGVCDILASPKRRSELGRNNIATLKEISALIDKYRMLQNTANRQHEPLYGHIVNRLTEAAVIVSGGDFSR